MDNDPEPAGSGSAEEDTSAGLLTLGLQRGVSRSGSLKVRHLFISPTSKLRSPHLATSLLPMKSYKHSRLSLTSLKNN